MSKLIELTQVHVKYRGNKKPRYKFWHEGSLFLDPRQVKSVQATRFGSRLVTEVFLGDHSSLVAQSPAEVAEAIDGAHETEARPSS